MVTDSWTHARELVARFLARIGADAAAIAGLDNARTRLLTTDATTDEQAVTAVRAQCQIHLRELVEAGSTPSGALRILRPCRPTVVAAQGLPEKRQADLTVGIVPVRVHQTPLGQPPRYPSAESPRDASSESRHMKREREKRQVSGYFAVLRAGVRPQSVKGA